MRVLTTAGRAVKPKVGDVQVQPVTNFAMMVASNIIDNYINRQTGQKHEAWITSLIEGRHKPNSLHYEGLAFDVDVIADSGVVHDNTWSELLEQLKENLEGCGYQVMYSRKSDGSISHFHIEWDP